jgi:hypothetical protein
LSSFWPRTWRSVSDRHPAGRLTRSDRSSKETRVRLKGAGPDRTLLLLVSALVIVAVMIAVYFLFLAPR